MRQAFNRVTDDRMHRLARGGINGGGMFGMI
jgi:hypothetical protein